MRFYCGIHVVPRTYSLHEQVMRIFLSFHNELSHSVATELHKFIPRVIQAAKPFLADQDMYSGTRWSDVVANELYK
jgi:hypothetical protein